MNIYIETWKSNINKWQMLKTLLATIVWIRIESWAVDSKKKVGQISWKFHLVVVMLGVQYVLHCWSVLKSEY